MPAMYGRLVVSEHVCGLDLVGGQPPDLLHFVDEQAYGSPADFGEQDSRLTVDGRLRRARIRYESCGAGR
jgi:hypothetical protein